MYDIYCYQRSNKTNVTFLKKSEQTSTLKIVKRSIICSQIYLSYLYVAL